MRKGEIVKERILKTAIKLFSIHGFEATTFQLIAEKSKVSSTTPLYYFKTKEALIESAINLILIHNSLLLNEIMKPEDNAIVRIKKHFQLNLEWARRYRDEAQVILLVYYLASFNVYWAKIYNQILKGARLKIFEYLLAGKREQLFYFDISTELLAEILHDALLGGLVNSISTHQVNKSSFESVIQKWDIFIDQVVVAKTPPNRL